MIELKLIITVERRARSRERFAVDIKAEEEVINILGQSGEKVTRLKIRMYIETDQQEGVISIT